MRSRWRPGGAGGFFPGATLDMNFAQSRYLGATPTELTVTRASDAYAESSEGVWSSFGSGVPRITNSGLLVEEARTNSIRNNSMQGAVPGTPGTVPTNWFIPALNAGISSQIVGTGTQNGIDYIDVRFFGTNGGVTLNNPIQFETPTGIAAVTGQSWTVSAFVRQVAGSTTGLNVSSPVLLYHIERDAGGVFLTNASVNCPFNTSSFTRTAFNRTTNQATTAFIQPQLTLNVDASATIDITLRIGWPQLELGAFATSPVRTTTVAVTRAADNVSLTGANFTSWYTGTSHTMFAESSLYTAPASSTSNPTMLSIDDGTSNERMQLRRGDNSGNPTGLFLVIDGGVSQVSTASVTGISFRPGKIAGTIATNDAISAINGTLVAQDTSATLPTPNRATIGFGISAAYANGYIRRIAYFPSRLSNAELQAITT